MALTFRDVKGSPLTAAEVDENFRTLSDAIDGFVSADGVGIATISVVGNEMFVTLTDASVQGPFPLPKAAFTWRDEWVGGTEYFPYDVFTVADSGVYLVLYPYTAPTEFDPDVTGTDGPLLDQMFGLTPVANIAVVHVDDATYTALPNLAGSYLRMENGPGAEFLVGADDGWVEGDVLTIRRTAGQVDVLPADTVTIINPPADCLPILRTAGSTATLIYVGSNEWDLSGDLAQVGSTTTGT